MALSKPSRKHTRLGVAFIGAALVIAAFLGAVIGLIWQSSSFGEDDEDVLSLQAPAD